jgi:hypothetical protein
MFLPRRPTARPVEHPQAAAIRRAALSALSTPRKASGPEELETMRALCECLAEVADPAAVDQVALLLAGEDDRHRAGHLMGLLDTCYGLPRSYADGGICGLSTPEEIREFERAEMKRCNEAKAALLAWHKQHKDQPLSQRIDAALDVWESQIADQTFLYLSESGDWATQLHFTPLIRMGEPAVAALRQRALNAPADESWRRGPYEIALGAITGQVDQAFVERLFKGTALDQTWACEIVAAAGSRNFKDHLATIVQSQGPYKKASYTLAVIYRAEAIEILKKAWPDDFIASCAIAELRLWDDL